VCTYLWLWVCIYTHLMGIDTYSYIDSPTISTQIVEKGVLIKGSVPIGAFATVPLDTFRWHKSQSYISGHTLMYMRPIELLLDSTQHFCCPSVSCQQCIMCNWHNFRISVGTVSSCLLVYLRYSMPFFTTNCGFPSDTGLPARSQYFFKVVSDFVSLLVLPVLYPGLK